jgi:hypothetical protein
MRGYTWEELRKYTVNFFWGSLWSDSNTYLEWEFERQKTFTTHHPFDKLVGHVLLDPTKSIIVLYHHFIELAPQSLVVFAFSINLH